MRVSERGGCHATCSVRGKGVVVADTPHTGCGEGVRTGDRAHPGPTLVLQLEGPPCHPPNAQRSNFSRLGRLASAPGSVTPISTHLSPHVTHCRGSRRASSG